MNYCSASKSEQTDLKPELFKQVPQDLDHVTGSGEALEDLDGRDVPLGKNLRAVVEVALQVHARRAVVFAFNLTECLIRTADVNHSSMSFESNCDVQYRRCSADH